MAFGLTNRQAAVTTIVPLCLAVLLASQWQSQGPDAIPDSELLEEFADDSGLELIQKRASRVHSKKADDTENLVTEATIKDKKTDASEDEAAAAIEKEATRLLRQAKLKGLDGLAFLEEVYQSSRQQLDSSEEVERVKHFTEQLKASKFMREVYETTFQELAAKAAAEHAAADHP